MRKRSAGPDLFDAPQFAQKHSAGDGANDVVTSDAVSPAVLSAEVLALAAKLPASIYLGTSSWYFPGWKDIVWDRAPDQKTLAREGLRAYAQHPLLRTVGIDRTYYAPLPASEFSRYAAQVPTHFRALIKAPSAITTPAPLTRDADGAADHFLDGRFAISRYVEPCLQGLEQKAGVLLFQFPPLRREFTRDPERFAQRLRVFLKQLPQGPVYAIELRNPELFTAVYAEVLSACGVRHCIGIHPRTPSIAQQLAIVRGLPAGPLVVRWNLNPHTGRGYDEAKDIYAPFDRLADEDLDTRRELARLCAAQARNHQPAYVVINNKAEGSAPLSAIALAQEICAV